MRWWRLAVATLLLAGCATIEQRDPGVRGRQGVSVVRVIDGDSLIVETGAGPLEVRLDGVNTPEVGECHHEAAREHLTAMLENSVLTLGLEGVDRFGRALARLEADGIDVVFEQVRWGHGLAVASAADAERLITAEEAAHRERVGMWGNDCRRSPDIAVGFDTEGSVTDPPGDDGGRLDDEIVLVVNSGDRPVDLAGWQLRDGSSRHRFRFADGSVLAPGKRIAVASSAPGWAPSGEPVWSNIGDVAILADDSGRVVARWRYRAPLGT
ncbi:MAG: lamin tail domain-containing protein [Acidimicrobiia bacterium]